MALLELHKNRDGVDLISDAPDIHVFSEQYVARETAEGWLAYDGDPVTYTVTPDPLGEMKHAGDLELTLPGDHLVLRVRKDGVPTEVRYRITHLPVPRGFRLEDANEPDGIRAANEYGLERMS